jgi:hypothetical protein
VFERAGVRAGSGTEYAREAFVVGLRSRDGGLDDVDLL